MQRSESQRALFDLAREQSGYFTAKQAAKLGYTATKRNYHVRVGNWIRERRGIFRLAVYPQPDRPDLVLWWLWSRGRSDVPAGVFSHATALSLHDLTDANPARIDLTVPASFRRGAPILSVLRLHFADIPKSEREVIGGVPVTNALRTILDTRKEGKLPLAPLKQAFEHGLRSGKVTQRQVAEARKDPNRASVLSELERGAA